MIINSTSLINSTDLTRTCWAGIRRFHNVPYVQEIICRLHNISGKQISNAKKQAEQIKYCLTQAKEYYDASKTVSLATKPVLMYYSIMSLALAEILLKSDGNNSLDKARGQHAHHGLDFRLDLKLAGAPLEEAAPQLRAIPLIRGADRFGTFELWHRCSREMPVLGEQTFVTGQGTTTTSYGLLMVPDDKPPAKLSRKGITLLELLQTLPSMYDFLASHGSISYITRANVSVRVLDGSPYPHQNLQVIIHPYHDPVLDVTYEHIRVKGDDLDLLNITELSSGVILKIASRDGRLARFMVPQSSTWSKEEVRFFASNQSLNEFGLFYVSFFIAGNFARYYPDKWLQEIERATPLALAIEELIHQAEERIPLLSLSELTRNYRVPV